MKKLIMSALAAALVASPLAVSAAEAAPFQQRQTVTERHDDRGRTVITRRSVSRQPQYRTDWRKGERFDRRHARNYRQIDYRQYRGRHLYAPPRGYQWVQSGNDAVLIAITSGVIGAVLGGALR